eukprot:5028313-Prymnesium_polylepis.1
MGPTPKCGHTHAGAVRRDTWTQTGGQWSEDSQESTSTTCACTPHTQPRSKQARALKARARAPQGGRV